LDLCPETMQSWCKTKKISCFTEQYVLRIIQPGMTNGVINFLVCLWWKSMGTLSILGECINLLILINNITHLRFILATYIKLNNLSEFE